MTPTSILTWIWRILTGYVSYTMIIIGNIGAFILILHGTPIPQLASLLFGITVFDIGTIALTLYYWKKPLPKSAK